MGQRRPCVALGTVLLLLGHGKPAWNGKAMLVGHWQALLPMADALQFTRATGAVELMLVAHRH